MLHIKLIAVGGLGARHFREAADEYKKRLGSFCRFAEVEIAEYKLPGNPSNAQIAAGLQREGESILKAMEGHYAVALCIEGRRMTSAGLAELLAGRALQGDSRIAFVIGSSHGLHCDVVKAAQATLSLSDMTLPHQLARVVLMEQIYRAFSINSGTKYHK